MTARTDGPSSNEVSSVLVVDDEVDVREAMALILQDHGFAVILSPGTKGLIRVLVGPYTDQQAFGKAKTDLENAGMAPQRYRP